jgi:hypothetical protein
MLHTNHHVRLSAGKGRALPKGRGQCADELVVEAAQAALERRQRTNGCEGYEPEEESILCKSLAFLVAREEALSASKTSRQLQFPPPLLLTPLRF